MVGASSLAFPGSRTLSAWRRQLAAYQARGLWVGYLFLHFVEAQVWQARALAVDSLTRRLLGGLALATDAHVPSAGLIAYLDAVLHLGMGPIRRWLEQLGHAGLVQVDADRTSLSAAGRQALSEGSHPGLVPRRWVFPFVESLDPAGKRLAPPHFLPLDEVSDATPWQATQDHRFEPAWLEQCLSAPDDFKRRFAFPPDMAARPGPSTGSAAWREVLLDRTERLLVVLAQADTPDGPAWLGFPARPEGWQLHAARPILRLPPEAQSALPTLEQTPTLDDWTRGWRAWCSGRHVPEAEAAGCRLEVETMRLRLSPSPRLLERLGQAKSDLLKGEIWLLAGEGYLRAALPVEAS